MTFDEKAGNKSSYGHKKSKLKNPLLRSRSSKHEAGGSGGGGGGGFVTNGVIGGKVKIINFNNGFILQSYLTNWEIRKLQLCLLIYTRASQIFGIFGATVFCVLLNK